MTRLISASAPRPRAGAARVVATVLAAAALVVAAAATGWAEVLIGGASVGPARFEWTAPGINQTFGEAPGFDAHAAAEVPMPAGTLSKLRFDVKPKGQNGGSARIRVHLNGTPTDLSCTVDVSGGCTSTVLVPVAEGSLLAVRVINNLKRDGATNPDGITFTYSLDFAGDPVLTPTR